MEKENINKDDDSETEDLLNPPLTVKPIGHPLWPAVEDALREVYDPEIPVNIYELGLILKVNIDADTNDVDIDMTLTSPACPVAGEMPGMVMDEVANVEGIGKISVELVWDVTWMPSMMSEAAKLYLNIY